MGIVTIADWASDDVQKKRYGLKPKGQMEVQWIQLLEKYISVTAVLKLGCANYSKHVGRSNCNCSGLPTKTVEKKTAKLFYIIKWIKKMLNFMLTIPAKV
jgi:hypothetical protein